MPRVNACERASRRGALNAKVQRPSGWPGCEWPSQSPSVANERSPAESLVRRHEGRVGTTWRPWRPACQWRRDVRKAHASARSSCGTSQTRTDADCGSLVTHEIWQPLPTISRTIWTPTWTQGVGGARRCRVPRRALCFRSGRHGRCRLQMNWSQISVSLSDFLFLAGNTLPDG